MQQWQEDIDSFIRAANKYHLRMIMVGGGAVNFHGYQRHSADVDFWIDTSDASFNRLIQVFRVLGYEIDDFPKEVKQRKQNISVKFSPEDLNLELITNFDVNKTFDQAYQESEQIIRKDDPSLSWRILSFQDLITSKIKAGRPKDLLDVQELQRIRNR